MQQKVQEKDYIEQRQGCAVDNNAKVKCSNDELHVSKQKKKLNIITYEISFLQRETVFTAK